jgi:hypothetical protein
MEHFFEPRIRRLPTIEPHVYTELQLAVSIEAFLNENWDWSDFKTFVRGDEGEMWKIMWITEDTFIWIEDENTAVAQEFDQLEDYAIQRVTLTAPSGETHILAHAMDMYSAPLSAGESSVFWHAVTTSNCVKLKLEKGYSWYGLYSPALLNLLLQFHKAIPSLELLEFKGVVFKEAQCRSLAALERTGLEVTFQKCTFDALGVEGTFIEWLRHSQVVTKLENCTMDDIIISALSGNSSVKSLSMDSTITEYCDYHTRSLARALPGNQGIENLSVSLMIDETPSPHATSSLLLRSLWAHPRIQSLTLSFEFVLSTASKARMMNAVLRMAQCNTVVHTIDFIPDDSKDEEFFQNSIVPRLEMNRNFFEDQRRALTRADPSIRGQLLGQALHVVRHNPDLLFRFLSENVPTFVRSDEDGPIIPFG